MGLGKGELRQAALEELVEIQPGYQNKGQMTHDTSGDLAFIQVQNLDHDSRMVQPSGIWKMNAPKDLSYYRVSEDDLLYLSRGSKFGAYRIPKLVENTIPLAHFFILRPRPSSGVSKDYLWWVLNDRRVATKVRSEMRGSMMPFIGRAELAQLKVPIPSREVQEVIVSLAVLRTREKQLVAEIETAKDRLYEGLMEQQIYNICNVTDEARKS